MRALPRLLLVLVLSLSAACAMDDSPSATKSPAATHRAVAMDRVDVRKVFESYKAAILAEDGEMSVRSLTQSSFDRYEKLRVLALDGEGPVVRALPLFDRLTVAALRAQMTAAELATIDGKGLIVLSVDRGMIGAESVTGLTLGDVKLNDDVATADIKTDAGSVPGGFRFRYEGDRWLFDLAALMDGTSKNMDRMGNPDLEAELLRALGRIAGKPVGKSIYDKPLR